MSQIFYRRLFIILFGLFVSASSGAAQVSTPVNRNAALDFDGDNKTDLTVWRPETGYWYIVKSSDGNFIATPFGIKTDKLVPGDYDGKSGSTIKSHQNINFVKKTIDSLVV